MHLLPIKILPVELLDLIFYYTDDYRMVLPFQHIISSATTKYLLRHQKFKTHIIKDNLMLFQIMLKFRNYIGFHQHYNLSERFIRAFQYRVKWSYISKGSILSESFIREFKDRIHWHYVSQYQILSESFIIEFADKLNWLDIYKYQLHLSEEFTSLFITHCVIRDAKSTIDKSLHLLPKDERILRINQFKKHNKNITTKNIRNELINMKKFIKGNSKFKLLEKWDNNHAELVVLRIFSEIVI